jgi:hypothetical protein
MIPPEVLQAVNTLTLQQKQELQKMLKEQIKQLKQEQREARNLRSRQVVDQQQVGSTTFQLERVDCRNERCRKCIDGPSHGPYWYAYAWNPGLKRVVSRYIGKKRPMELAEKAPE